LAPGQIQTGTDISTNEETNMRYIQPKITAVHSAVTTIKGFKGIEVEEAGSDQLTNNGAYHSNE
jgi:hypothetical protein